MASEGTIFSDDFTRLSGYQSKQFSIGDLSLGGIGGLYLKAAKYAILVATGTCILPAILGLLLGFGLWWLTMALTPIPLIWTYRRLAKERTGGLAEDEKLTLALNSRLKQPARFLGLAENTEPVSFLWHVITYELNPLEEISP